MRNCIFSGRAREIQEGGNRARATILAARRLARHCATILAARHLAHHRATMLATAPPRLPLCHYARHCAFMLATAPPCLPLRHHPCCAPFARHGATAPAASPPRWPLPHYARHYATMLAIALPTLRTRHHIQHTHARLYATTKHKTALQAKTFFSKRRKKRQNTAIKYRTPL